MATPPQSTHVSPLPWSDERPETLLVCCSDGRYHPHLEEFAQRRVSERPDLIALPGGPAGFDGWAASFDHARVFEESLRLLVASHDLGSVWLVAHAGCSFYRVRHPGLDAAGLEQKQKDDLRRVRGLLRERYPLLAVHLIYARAADGSVVFEDVDAQGAARA